MNHRFRCSCIILFIFYFCISHLYGQVQAVSTVDTGYELWLNYKSGSNSRLKQSAIRYASQVRLAGSQYDEVIKEELERALKALLEITPGFVCCEEAGIQMSFCTDKRLGKEGYIIRSGKKRITLQAYSDAGFLYGTFHLIRLIQCGEPLVQLNIREIPALEFRQLNHWDDLNGNIERGYAGKSLWKWEELPEKVDSRYTDYARTNASIGINGVVLNNVNADPRILRRDYLKKVAALADVFRKYHIRVYLTANFAAPLEPSATPDVMKQWGGIGDLDTADPRDPHVQAWWKVKVDEIYEMIPDFGGFLVKANSEGMPGPQDYHCTHAEGANVLARALKPHGGILMWRTFVYNPEIDKDRMKRSYKEFQPLDGQFDENVVLQTKNGTLDFQPSEPAQPLFGAMRHTPLFPELQITQEYLGRSVSLVYLLPMWRKTFLDFDTYCNGKGSTVSNIIAGKTFPSRMLGMAGVGNIGRSRNWTAHHFAQANWYAFGRLAWNPEESTESITSDWIKSTWNCDEATLEVIRQMMMPTWESFVCAHAPYSLGFTVKREDHYTAGFEQRANKEWHVSKESIGTDRTTKGTNYVSQYFKYNKDIFNSLSQCPELYLLCFHNVPWSHKMKSGKSLREEFKSNLKRGIEQVDVNIGLWKSIRNKIDPVRYEEVLESLYKEQRDTKVFYQAALNFFSQYW